jgi:micrococcal nuclease
VAVALVAALSACTPSPPRPVALAGRRGRALPATVVRVVDGDTLDVSFAGGSGEVERVRLLGVDTPETVKPDTPVQCFGPEASHHTKALLAPGTPVLLQRDEEARDRYGRLLAYLWRARDRTFVNLELVTDGFARTLSIAPNTAYRPTLAAAQDRARARRAGLWGACGPGG